MIGNIAEQESVEETVELTGNIAGATAPALLDTGIAG